MTALAEQKRISAAEYLERERQAQFRSEYRQGEVVAMVGASRAHNLICTNVSRELSLQFKGRECEVYVSDMRVRIPATDLYTYPDVVAVCGGPRFEDDHVDCLLNPQLLVEVLSVSTEAYDRGEKFAQYRTVESLQEVLLITQDRARVEVYSREAQGWLLSEHCDLGGRVTLRSVDAELVLGEIYDKVPLAPARLR